MNHEENESANLSELDEHNEAPGEVGYGQPPKHSRFKTGQSGNGRGRPRGAKGNKKILEGILNERHWVTENGVRRRRSTLDLVLLSLRNRAIDGNVRAIRAVEQLSDKYAPREASEPSVLLLLPDNGRRSVSKSSRDEL